MAYQNFAGLFGSNFGVTGLLGRNLGVTGLLRYYM